MIGSLPIPRRKALVDRQRHASRRGGSTMVHLVTAAVRPTLIGALLFVLATAGLLCWIRVFSEPDLSQARAAAHALRAGERAMFDEQSALLGYVATNDDQFLADYRTAQAAAAKADAAAQDALRNGDAAVSTAFGQAWTAAQMWEDRWAIPAAGGRAPGSPAIDSAGAVSAAGQATFIESGTTLFDRYQSLDAAALTMAENRIRQIISTQTDVITAAGVAALLLGVAGCASLVVGRRRLQQFVIAPLDELSRQADRVTGGDYASVGATHTPAAIDEIAELTTSLQTLVSTLDEKRAETRQHTAELEDRTVRLQEVLELSRDLSASLSLGNVVSVLAEAMRRIAGADRAMVWLLNWDERTLTSFDPDHPESSQTIDSGSGDPIGRAARYAREVPLSGGPAATDSLGVAIPLVIGGRVIGVVSVVPRTGGKLDMEMVDSLVLHGAAAIQAARVHAETDELSRRDPLTGLANRRQLNGDIAMEIERALRLNHPLSFVMIDLDHFKRVNDRYGHQRGDEVLREVAAVISQEIRAIDGAYRYGGEELALLLREETGAEAARTVERIRAEIASRFAWAGESPITLSAGIAALGPLTMSPGTLIATADRALYDAKRGGRDRVILYDSFTDVVVGSERSRTA